MDDGAEAGRMTVLPTPWPRMDFTFLVSAVRIGIWNVPSPKTMSMPDGLKYNEMAQSLGFRDGDIPLRTDAVDD